MIGALRSQGNSAASTAAAVASCASAPTLAADTSTDTLLGVNATSNGQLSADTALFGHMSILRVYYSGMPSPNLWSSGVQGVNQSAVVVSFRSPPATVLSGADDAAFARFFDSAPTGYPIYWTYYHEPEPLIRAGDFSATQYKDAWSHIEAIANGADNPYLKPTMILMSWDLDPASHVDWQSYLPSGLSVLAWDAYPAGTVEDKNMQDTPPADFMGPAEAASRSLGLGYGFAEFALGTPSGRPQWLTSVADYLESTGALFGTLFDSSGFPWMVLNDSASIQAWRDAVAGSVYLPPPSQPSSPASSAPPSSSPSAAASPSGTSPSTPFAPVTNAAAQAIPSASHAPTISGAHVNPHAFKPRGTNHVRIMFKLSQPANTAICVLNHQGGIMGEIIRPNQAAGWSGSLYFGRKLDGGLLPGGRYPVLIVATNSAGTASAQAELTVNSG